MIEAHDILTELQSLRIQTSFLLAQHADHLREKARKEIVIGGWSTFIPNKEDTEKQGEQLEAQSVSRERWIKEIAKKAGLPSGYYKEWSFSHQTRGDSLSPITVVTVPHNRGNETSSLISPRKTATQANFRKDSSSMKRK